MTANALQYTRHGAMPRHMRVLTPEEFEALSPRVEITIETPGYYLRAQGRVCGWYGDGRVDVMLPSEDVARSGFIYTQLRKLGPA